MKKQLEDGLIELGFSGNTNPPGVVGQGGTKSTIWFRVDGRVWEFAGTRSMHKIKEALQCADTVFEFRQLLEIL